MHSCGAELFNVVRRQMLAGRTSKGEMQWCNNQLAYVDTLVL